MLVLRKPNLIEVRENGPYITRYMETLSFR